MKKNKKRNKIILKCLKAITIFFIFTMVLAFIVQLNEPKLEKLNSSVSTRYLEMPSGYYIGNVSLSEISGKGSFYFDTGEIYEGQWKDNEMNGKGKFTYTTGVYEGDFSNSKRNGQGTFT